ncbi:DMT family transporter [Notoacmeibacter sp. MSK16QG-6]|uniref:DMT family transporter n=1 Tax=Notoacmeibacter sp. MSK16QG-6 TaxID=2957982 RepID=UPI00209D1DCE|nr:DMT family transporter [Notoacmeibacter sp. MSK16QG-6]MCP1199638.1 DMT family transporter [Notoacmeibacter sp. MSK16QG-6]
MTALGLFLVLSAAICHATWNFLVKRIGGGTELLWLFSLVATGIYLPVAVIVLWIEQPVLDSAMAFAISGSALIHLAYFIVLQAGYRAGDLSVVYPIARSTGPFLSTCFAVLFLGETVTVQLAIGAAIIIGGVLCLTGGFRGGTHHVLTSASFGVGVGCLIASYTVWDAYAVSTILVPPLLLDYASSVLRVLILSPLAYRRRETIRSLWHQHRGRVVGIAVFSPLAYILVLYALRFTPVVYVAPGREISVVLAVVAGGWLLGEGDLPRRLVWSLVILVGMGLLVTG